MTKAVQDLMVEVERVRDAFHAAIFERRDAAAAAALAAEGATLTVLPLGTGAGAGELHRYLAEDLIPALPEDLAFECVTRVGDRWRVMDETTVRFTHDRPMPWLLPGLAPTGRAVAVLAVCTVGVRRSRVTGYRTLWDHATLLTQLGCDLSDVGAPV